MSEQPEACRLVVVGGGPSGLAAAWKASVEAERAGGEIEILVLEGGHRSRRQGADRAGRRLPDRDRAPKASSTISRSCGRWFEACGPRGRRAGAGNRPRTGATSTGAANCGSCNAGPLAFARSGLLGTARPDAADDGTPGAGSRHRRRRGRRRRRRRVAVRLRRPPHGAGKARPGASSRPSSSASSPATRGGSRQRPRFPRLVAMEQAYGSLFKAMRAGRKRGVPPPGTQDFFAAASRLFRRPSRALPGNRSPLQPAGHRRSSAGRGHQRLHGSLRPTRSRPLKRPS